MPEAEEILALTLIFVVHVAGGLMLLWGIVEGDARPRPWRRRRGGGGGPGDPPAEPSPSSPPASRTPLPLRHAEPSDVRLRDETPLREAYPRPPRRPQRAPERSPSRR